MTMTTRLKQIRKSRNLTQIKMSDLLRLNRNTYVHYELGQREPSLEQLIDIASTLGVSMDYLTGVSNFELTVECGLKFGILKKVRSVTTVDYQPYTPASSDLQRVAEKNPDDYPAR